MIHYYSNVPYIYNHVCVLQTFFISITMFVCFVYDIVPYHESTTLQPCRTAAAVGNTNYVCVACPRYAAASCLCQSMLFVTPPYHVSAVLPLGARVHRCRNIKAFVIAI